jgi:hypothetical protein
VLQDLPDLLRFFLFCSLALEEMVCNHGGILF